MTFDNPATAVTEARRRKGMVDEAVLCEVLEEQLAALGWQVSTAGNVKAAIGLLSRDLPDIAAIDISMQKLEAFGLQRHGGELASRTSPGTGLLAAIMLPASQAFLVAEAKHA